MSSATLYDHHIGAPPEQTAVVSEAQPKSKLSLQALQALEQDFARLTVVDSGVADLSSTKTLLKQVVAAQRTLELFSPDAQTTFEVFNLAFHKLSPKLRDQFLSIYCPNSQASLSSLSPETSLRAIVAFLQAEIVSQHSKAVWLATTLRANSLTGTSGGIPLSRKPILNPISDPSVPYCRYCKTIGHLYEYCRNVRQLLCFLCYQEGHTKRTCPQRPIPVFFRK